MEQLQLFLELFRPYMTYENMRDLFALMGFLRIINKPLFTALRSYVESTETKEDDKQLEKIERSQAYKMFLFVLDWFASVKPLSDKKAVEKQEEE